MGQKPIEGSNPSLSAIMIYKSGTYGCLIYWPNDVSHIKKRLWPRKAGHSGGLGEGSGQGERRRVRRRRAFGPTRTLIIDEARIDRLDPHALEAALWLTEDARLLSESENRHILDQTGQHMRRILKRCGKPCS